MRILVLNYADFTKSSAVTSRIKAYCKGLNHKGIETEVVITTPNFVEQKLPMEGSFDGLNYRYIQQRRVSERRLIKTMHQITHFFHTYILLRTFKKNKEVEFVFHSMDTPLYMIYYIVICKLVGLKSIFVADEYPVDMRERGKDHISKKDHFLYKLILPFYIGRIFINEKLVCFYNNISVCKNTFILPTIIDTDRFETVTKETDDNYLCYLGGMDLSNDNIDLIIHAFNRIKDEFSDLNLHLYGSPNMTDKKILENLISEYDINNRVILKGRIGYKEVPSVLKSARALVTSQSNTLRAEGGLPTKVGEYIASGTVSIMSNVSTIPDFLENGKHVYLVEPNNIDSYVNTLRNVLNDKERSTIVGETGRQYIIEHYSYRTQGKRLYEFINQLMQ